MKVFKDKYFKILQVEELAQNVKKVVVEAPLISQKAQAGQFIMVRAYDGGERIPLTVADKNEKDGTITLIFQEVGKTTKLLGTYKEGDEILDLVGPLGHSTELKNYGTVVCIGGGVGIAEVYPVSKGMKNAGNNVIGIIGGRSKDYVILKDEMESVCDTLYITTDDGSMGTKGFVSSILQNLIDEGEQQISLVYAIGPVPMMQVICGVTKPYNIHTVVSLNPIMVDGTGMCGACRVEVDGKTKFACVDGPEFDGHKVDWDILKKRLILFKEQELYSLEEYNKMIAESKKQLVEK